MSIVEIYVRFVCGIFIVYALIVTRAYLATRSHLRYYKRHYDRQPKMYNRKYKPTVCQKVVDYLITLSPIK